MSEMIGDKIDPSRLNELKERVKAECARRKYTGSVESYSGTNYDFTNVPKTETDILKEHYDKITDPMNAINQNNTPDNSENTFNELVLEDKLTAMEVYLTAYETRDVVDKSPTDCAASCTGTCTLDCTGTCTSDCSGGCRGGCRGCGGCSSTCRGDCKGSCRDGCSGGCSSYDCGKGCKGDCYTSCSKKCDTGCSKRCGYCDSGCRGYVG